DVLYHFARGRIGRVDGPLHGRVHFARHLRVDAIQLGTIHDALIDQVRTQDLERIPLGRPLLLFLFRPVVLATDIPHMVAPEPVGIAEEKGRTVTPPRALDA